jgi:predicted O-linked N-acetylglucosamine transferase (SPINDLY family)
LVRGRSNVLVPFSAAAGALPAKPNFASVPLREGASQPLELPQLRRDQRLRIGFLSAEIGNHVVASFLFSFLENYDREHFAVELFAASRRFDVTASELARLADHHWLLDGMEIGRARDLIRSRQLDILVETSGFTADSAIELLAERCAPVQCHYIGYHATTGLDTIDWFIGDGETVPEEFAPQFVEGLWRLPRPWLARQPDSTLPPACSESIDPVAVLGSFNQLAKVREETLRFWAAALQAVPSSRLLLKDRSVADAETRERIVRTLIGHGVASERISFLGFVGGWEDHMATYNRLDVALDTTPWSSATTGFDALAMGVPLVAIRGGCTAARMSASILKGLGRPEWIAETPEQFAAIVAELCADLPALRASKPELRRRVLASPLFDGLDLTRQLEQAFLAMGAAPGTAG